MARLMHRVACLVFACVAGVSLTSAQEPIIQNATIQRLGLTRKWMGQAQIDRARDRVTGIVLDTIDEREAGGRDLFFVQSNMGLLHAMDAETGQTIWVKQIGDRNFISIPPAASDTVVAVINGQRLFVLNRDNGETIYEKKLRFTTSQQPIIIGNMVHIAAFNGQVSSINLSQEVTEGELDQKKWQRDRNYLSFGRIDVPPLRTHHSLAWATSRGFVYLSSLDMGDVRARFQTDRPVNAPLAFWGGTVFAASRDGYIYALEEMTGRGIWEYSIGSPINRAPIAVEGRVLVLPEAGGMHSLDPAAGTDQWYSPRPRQFLAATPSRLYVTDAQGHLVAMDRANGGTLGRESIDPRLTKYENTQTDRIYLVSKTGLVQCLHEQTAAKPTLHRSPRPLTREEQQKLKDKKKTKKPLDDEAAEEADAESEDAMEEESEDEGAAEEGMTEEEDADENDGDPFNN